MSSPPIACPALRRTPPRADADFAPPATALKSVREHADAIHALLAKTSVNVVQIGLRLQAVRNALGRSRFQPWLKAEFDWSRSVASNYMRAAKAFSELDCLGQFQPSALFVLARKRCPAAARAEAIRRASRGERVTKALAVELVGRSAAPRQAAGLAERLRRSLLKAIPRLSPQAVEELGRDLLRAADEMRCGDCPRGL